MKPYIAALILLNSVNLVSGLQPGAAEALPAPLRELQFGALNFLHTTDTHGWHAGHLLENSYSADWGDYISFATRLRARLESEGKDLIVCDSGDRVEGNGLYDSSDPRGKYTFDIFKGQSIDVLSIGNHELYKNSSAEDDYRKLVPYYRENYVATNLYIQGPDSAQYVPFANYSRTFTTKKNGIRILAFGFIFDFTRNDRITKVIPVEDAVKEKRFTDTVRTAQVDLILVVGHIALSSFEFELVHQAIRAVDPSIPVLFLGGHYHIRDARVFDNRSQALASGRFMETIGFQSISNIKPKAPNENVSYFRRYIDNNLFSLRHHSNTTTDTFDTPLGLEVSRAITVARTELNLDQTFGCAVQDYWMSRVPYPHRDSIFSLLTDEIFPDVVNPERRNKTRLILTNTGAIRFDLFQGKFTRDSTFIVSPFTSQLQYIKDVPFGLAKQLLAKLNSGPPAMLELMQLLMLTKGWKYDPSVLPPPPQQHINLARARGLDDDRHQEDTCGTASSGPNLRTRNLDPQHAIQQPLHAGAGHEPLGPNISLIPGYTTVDALGADGDDTIHSPIPSCNVPNCIQAIFPAAGSNISLSSRVDRDLTRTETMDPADSEPVDLLFNGFLRPMVLSLLNVLPYLPASGFVSHDSVPELWTYPDYVTAMQWKFAREVPACVAAGECEDTVPPEEAVEVWERHVDRKKRELGLEGGMEKIEVALERRKYAEADVLNYMPGETFTTILASWIKKNWAKNCPKGTDLV